MLKIDMLDSQCEDRCIIGTVVDRLFGHALLYDGNVVEEGKVTKFNFCPGCGQELRIMTNKTESGMRFSKL